MEPGEQEVLDTLVSFFEERIPFNRWLGIQVTVATRGYCRLKVPYRPELVGDPFRPALHGGVLSTLADTAGGFSLFLRVAQPRARISTLDLRVDYYEPGLLQDLYADAHVLRAGSRVGVARVALHHGDPQRMIAEGKGVYMIRPPRGEDHAAAP